MEVFKLIYCNIFANTKIVSGEQLNKKGWRPLF